uniref:Granulins domain-containing protein n=1 Tax=Monopterus albus TaxID=43700 RepID=A0A3Q3ISC3_MONAL
VFHCPAPCLCPDETTCCETPEGKWGCCPLPKVQNLSFTDLHNGDSC